MPRMNVTPDNRAELEQLAARMAELGYPIALPPEHTGYDVWIVNEDGAQIAHVGFFTGDTPADADSLPDDVQQAVAAEMARQARIISEQSRLFTEVYESDDPTLVTGRVPYVSAVNRNGLHVELR